MLAAGYRPSGSFRGAKATLFEGGHRVPFLVRWPREVAAGTTSDTTLCTTDFFATFADLLGRKASIPDSAAEDSFSFLPAMKGDPGPIRPFTIHHDIGGSFAIRQGDWKLILSTKSADNWGGMPGEKAIKTPSKIVQLYDLKADPGETRNLEDTEPEKVEELVNVLAKALADGRTTPGAPQSNDGWPYLHKPTLAAFPQLGGDAP
jgi:arylsulfatase A-like enzyme